MVNGKGKIEGQDGTRIICLIQQWKHGSGLLLEQEKQNCVQARHALLWRKLNIIVTVHIHTVARLL